MSTNTFERRRLKLLNNLKDDKDDKTAIILSNPSDITYFSNFSEFLLPREREALLYIDQNQTILFYPSLTSLLPLDHGVTTLAGVNIANVLGKLQIITKRSQISKLYIDPESLLAGEYLELSSKLGCPLVILNRQFIWQQRMIKDQEELNLISQANKIALQAFKEVFPQIITGITEKQLAFKIEKIMKHQGAKGPSFPTIIAFGTHTALSHHQPTDRSLEKDQAVLLDFGANYQGYCSDVTRSFWHGNNPPSLYKSFRTAVDEAYDSTITMINQKSFSTIADLDKNIHQIFNRYQLEPLFTHTTGHGLGLDIHEPPSISSRNLDQLQVGMTITIEPGLYQVGKYGYRHENTIII